MLILWVVLCFLIVLIVCAVYKVYREHDIVDTFDGSVEESNATFGFILLRHVNSVTSNLYWQQCYMNVRTLYPKQKIIIIDDNSDVAFLQSSIVLYNTEIIYSEYPQRGELLPYIYFLRHKWFDKAIILHDSTFLLQPIDVEAISDYAFLWTFEHTWDNPELERSHIAHLLNKDEVITFHENQAQWKGCFGAMSVVCYDYLKQVDERSDLQRLINVIRTRTDRMAFERIIACLLEMNRNPPHRSSLYGCIHKFCKWGKTIQEVTQADLNKPIVKVWTGR